jgi:nucleoid-associated protein YgaU
MITVVPHSAPAAQQVSTSVPVNRPYVVKPGDNLWSIAEQFYGTGFRWDTICHANSGQIGSNPNAGQRNWQADPGYANTILARAAS